MEPILAQLLFLLIADLQKIADFFQLETKIFYLPQMVDFSDLFLLDPATKFCFGQHNSTNTLINDYLKK